MTARDFLALVEKNRADFEFERIVRRVAEHERGPRPGRGAGAGADGRPPGQPPKDHAGPHAGLTARLGRPPTAKELAAALGVRPQRAYQLAQAKGLALSRGQGRCPAKARRDIRQGCPLRSAPDVISG